jgi:hypothetical protein
MMNIRSIALALAVITLAAPEVIARVDVKIDFDKSFNFKAARTWDWNAAGPGEVKMARTQTDDPNAMQTAVDPVVVEAVTAEMARLGLTQAASYAPDLIVTYFLLLTTNQQAQQIGQFLPAMKTWGLPPFPEATQSLTVLHQGALVIDLGAKDTVVWRGVARANIKTDVDYKKREALLRQSVRDLLRRYPPKQ